MKKGLVLSRKIFTDKSTLGEIFLDGEYLGDTLEDTCRKYKVQDHTAIPSGTYEVIIRESQRFKRRLPALLKVPYFDGILIHPGNTPSNTSGCVLVGKRDGTNPDYIIDSRTTFDEIFPKIEQYLAKDRLWIDICGGYSVADFENFKKFA